MRRFFWFLLAFSLLACQPQLAKTTVHILDGNNIVTLQADSLSPAALVAQAGLTLSTADKILYNGYELPADFSLPPAESYILQIRRARTLTLRTAEGETAFQTTAATLGQALAQTGLQLFAQDYVEPPVETPINTDLTVTYRPARDFAISMDGKTITMKSSAQKVGQALAEAGIPLVGLDKSLPAESAPVPANGQIKIIRVTESVTLMEKSIPFKVEYQMSAALELDTQNLLQAGEAGLSISRVHVRTEDGVEVSRKTEEETLVRPPKDRIVGQGTKINVRTLEGGTQYWRAVRMYATWYSPCHSGVPYCSYNTASGLPVKRGVVAMIRRFYNMMAGQQVYIPGYGTATIGDVGGGMPDGRLWIDLAYSEDDTDHLSGWVTVYFLTPVPANILYTME